MRRLLLLAFLVLVAPACRSTAYHLTGKPNVMTLTNLHPDEVRGRLYSTNYLRNGLMPRCTEVRIDAVSNRKMRFTVVDTGRTYTWKFMRDHMVEAIPDHLDRYFGTQCSPSDVAHLSEVDRRGILEGKIYVGMSRQAVIYAVGYPPPHATPRLDSPYWRYWRNRFNTMVVHFQNDQVARIEN